MITSRIELDNISKKYPFKKDGSGAEDFWALKDVSLKINMRGISGIIGRNGAGKTTFLNIIAGTLSPSQGKVSLNGKVVGLFNLGVGFQDELTGLENIFLNGAILGATRKELEAKLNTIIEFSELGEFIDMPLGSYSQGMRLRLGFSIIANIDFDILVVDEVLAVGDSLFQSKCYERLMDLKRQGKTLIITSQDMGIIERFCDEVVLLDHGRVLFKGAPLETINRYRTLLNTEKFFVGPGSNGCLVENTKKWAQDMQDWGKRLGTKEVIIESVKLINKFGFAINKIKSGESLRIEAIFTAKDKVDRPHFGVAIFREDGVYCYGPNTKFDRYDILELKPGRGCFTLTYDRILLAPGTYRISVAIWDKNEKVAFDYHNGFYEFEVTGKDNPDKQLLDMPYKIKRVKNAFQELGNIIVKLLSESGVEKNVFTTDHSMRLAIYVAGSDIKEKHLFIWAGIYRDDGIYCQGIQAPLKEDRSFIISFNRLPLLPGPYSISVGIYDSLVRKFLIRHDNICQFRMVFNRHDHGTVYLKHNWHIKGVKYENAK